jgi:hypothetical protein
MLIYIMDFNMYQKLHRTLVYLNGRSLYVSLSFYMYGSLEGNLVYMPVMDLRIGSWHSPKRILVLGWLWVLKLIFRLLEAMNMFYKVFGVFFLDENMVENMIF